LNILGNLDEEFGGGFETWDSILDFGGDDDEYLSHAAGSLGGQRGGWGVRVRDDGSDGCTLFATEASVRLFAHEMGFGHRVLDGHALPLRLGLGLRWLGYGCGNVHSFLG
jgi:hypothetical protein